MTARWIVLLALLAVPAQASDLVLMNGKIVTVDPGNPEAQALAVTGDRIDAVTTNGAILEWITEETRVIDLKGRLVVPGLIESHAHLSGLGKAAMILDLVGTESAEEIAAMVKKRAAEIPAGQWIQGRGWDQNDWPMKRFPTHALLTEAAPDHPVYLTRIDGHASWVNGKAMALAGLKEVKKDPVGGKVIRDESGRPTGVLIDTAESLVARKIPPMSSDESRAAVMAALVRCVSFGITGFHDAGAGQATLDLYQQLENEGKLPLRLYVMLSGGDDALLKKYFAMGPQVGSHFTVRSVKLFADGALGSRGAAMIEPYDDDPGNCGLMMNTEEELFAVSEQALEHGFQVCTHAIGDRGNRITLNAYEQSFTRHPSMKDHRFRIEHAQILAEADIPRFAALGVIPSMQPTHCTSDMPWVPIRVGEARAKMGAYVWQKLLATGVCIPAGSDAPVESVNPLWGFYAAITRQDHQGNPPGGWDPDQRMTREQALKAFTLDGAYAAFEEKFKGSLKAGKLADLVVLDKDIMTVPAKEILQTEVVMTVVGGKTVYER